VINTDGLSIVFDNNDPSTPFNPDLITPLERIKSSNEPPSRYYKLLEILLMKTLTLNTKSLI